MVSQDERCGGRRCWCGLMVGLTGGTEVVVSTVDVDVVSKNADLGKAKWRFMCRVALQQSNWACKNNSAITLPR